MAEDSCDGVGGPLGVSEIETIFDPLQTAVHPHLETLAAKIIAAQRIDLLAHPDELVGVVGEGSLDFSLARAKAI